MYEYLFGSVVLGGSVWTLIYLTRKDLRSAMLWSGGCYVAFLTIAFVPLQFLSLDPSYRINPGYWSPPTMFDLNNKTGGYSIEDAVFMFFIAGIATAIYKVITRRTLTTKPDKRMRRNVALPFMAGVVIGLGASLLFKLNLMHGLLLFNVFGGLIIVYIRRDLAKQAFCSGFLLLLVYGALFGMFNLIFPWFVEENYNLQHMTRIVILGTPLEEYLYALTFGFFWGPLYEYERQLKTKRIPNRNTKRLRELKRSAA